MDGRPKRSLWRLLVPLFLVSIWVDVGASYIIAVVAPGLSPLWNTLSQLTIAGGIATVDLYVIYWVLGLGEHAHEIGDWMSKAFRGEGLKTMTSCPRCGYTPAPSEPSKAEQLLRKREYT
ncbi:MAG: hypothetical protein L3K19_09705 [Thermoplasmata archaeon]|nr:hypothetical protein [Thermoplasmata archaeon]